LSVSSWPGRKILGGRSIVQLRLDLAESPAPAAALWELLGEQQRGSVMAQLSALIARAVAGDLPDDRASLGGSGAGGRND
jgi:hypothetical protein